MNPDRKGILTVEALTLAYGTSIALRDVSFRMESGEAVAIAGSNGAGKSSLLSAVAGAAEARQTAGRVIVQSRVLAPGDIGARLRHGLRLVPETDKVFGLLSVDENFRIGARGARTPAGSGGKQVDIDDILVWFPRLRDRRQTLAGNLSGGEQQMLAIAIALLGNPRILLLDEPTLGLATPVIEAMCESLRTLRRDLGLSLLVAESDSQWLPHLVDRALILSRGELTDRVDRLDAASRETIHDRILGLAPSDRQDALERLDHAK